MRGGLSVEDADRQYNLEDESQKFEVREDISTELVRKIVAECCGGLHTKRASIVMDRYGLLGRRELRNKECAQKYGLTKFAVNSHTYSFKCKAREKFPELILYNGGIGPHFLWTNSSRSTPLTAKSARS